MHRVICSLNAQKNATENPAAFLSVLSCPHQDHDDLIAGGFGLLLSCNHMALVQDSRSFFEASGFESSQPNFVGSSFCMDQLRRRLVQVSCE
jgi:hypothetical protein